jgi:hypothetical protein
MHDDASFSAGFGAWFDHGGNDHQLCGYALVAFFVKLYFAIKRVHVRTLIEM